MTYCEANAVLDRWANCRCVYSRAPTDPCNCRFENGRWVCDNPVKEYEELTAREKAERRKAKGGKR